MKFLNALILFLSCAVSAQTLRPGIWKAKINFSVNNIPLPETQEEDCILSHEVRDIKSSLKKNLKKQGCTLTKWDVKGHKLNAALNCKGSDLNAKGSIQGEFSEKSYKLKGEAEGTYKEMLPAMAKIDLKGDWVKTCTE